MIVCVFQKYVNVDTTSISGLERAKSFDLANSGSVDVIFSSYIKETSAIFSDEHKGRGFVLLRDPIERAISMFYYLADQPGNEEISEMTVEEYAQSTRIENNWMVRYLVSNSMIVMSCTHSLCQHWLRNMW